MHAPAAVLYGWAAPTGGAIRIDGLDGTLGNGHAAAIVYAGKPVLHDLRWRLHPWWLLLGKIDASVTTTDPHFSADGTARIGFGGLALRDFTAGGQIKSMLALAGYPFIPLDGAVKLHLDRLDIQGSALGTVKGQAELHELSWGTGDQAARLGDFAADLGNPDAKTTQAKVKTLAGPIDLSGDLSLTASGQYEINLALKPKSGAPQQVVELLKGIGRPDVTGTYRLRQQGRLPLMAGGG